MEALREDRIPDPNIFVQHVKEIIQKLCANIFFSWLEMSYISFGK